MIDNWRAPQRPPDPTAKNERQLAFEET
jgi:hypothetical protein